MKPHIAGQRKALLVYEFGTKTRYRRGSLSETYLAWHEDRMRSWQESAPCALRRTIPAVQGASHLRSSESIALQVHWLV
jgi:hypothetical protein